MLKPIPITDLANHSWKPCKRCNHGQLFANCSRCNSSGLEPVAVENELVEKMLKHGVINEWKLQVGVLFTICKFCKNIDFHHTDGHYLTCGCDAKYNAMKFLPLRPKVEGDLSVLMVVKV